MTIGTPFDIADVWGEFHGPIEYTENKVLDLGIAQIKQPLVAHGGYLTSRSLDNPVGGASLRVRFSGSPFPA